MMTVFENNALKVEVNSSTNEVFVINKNIKHNEMRIGVRSHDIIITAGQNQFTPWMVNGLPAIIINVK